MNKKILIMLGPAGSGKSTQAKLISQEFGFKDFIASSILKEEVKKGTKLGKEIKKTMTKGDLVPYQVSCDLLLKKIRKSRSKNIIIDGFPRDINQAVVLNYIIYANKFDFVGAVYIDLPKSVCVKRLLKRKRSDDNKEAIDERLKIYFKETKKVINKYKNLHKLIQIDGNNTIEKVYSQIKRKIKNKV